MSKSTISTFALFETFPDLERAATRFIKKRVKPKLNRQRARCNGCPLIAERNIIREHVRTCIPAAGLYPKWRLS